MPDLDHLMFSETMESKFEKLVATYPQKRSALIPMLILAQRELGRVTQSAILN